ncbi:unnamed protein product [Closterium sp. NIES-53]
MTTLRVLLHVAAQRDYELHSLEFSIAFLQGSLHEEIWQRCPPGFTGSFPAGTQWSLRRPVYSLRQAPREWHDTLRTTLAVLGFAPSTSDPSLFLHTDTTLPSFYVLVYVDDLVFATADTEALAHVKSKLQKRHSCTDLGELISYLGLRITRDRAQRTITLTQSHMVQQVLQRFGFTYSSPQSTPLPTGHSLSAPSLDESVEPSGPYPELVGFLMYLMTCTRPDLAYPLSLLARYVAPVHRAWGSSSCEAEIYAGAMAAQELHWLTYLLTDLGEAPRSPPVLYVDNKAMLALCQEHRLEHRTKHIALRYFLARELQQRGQLRLAYVVSQANTADVFTKALQPCDHQRACGGKGGGTAGLNGSTCRSTTVERYQGNKRCSGERKREGRDGLLVGHTRHPHISPPSTAEAARGKREGGGGGGQLLPALVPAVGSGVGVGAGACALHWRWRQSRALALAVRAGAGAYDGRNDDDDGQSAGRRRDGMGRRIGRDRAERDVLT